jgi:primary-amine oxidase
VIEDGAALASSYSLSPRTGWLSAQEVEFAMKVATQTHPDADTLLFASVDHVEPSKAELKAATAPLPRLARVTCMHVASNRTFVDVVPVSKHDAASAGAGRCSSRVLHDIQVSMTPTEYASCEQLVKAYSPLRDALIARGLDPACLAVDTWCVGYCGESDAPSERMGWALLCVCDVGKGEDLPYARPIEGIHLRLSITKMQVVLFDTSDFARFQVPTSKPEFNMSRPARERRTDLKPISITQPAGASFSVQDGNSVSWLGWEFQVGFNSREGLSLHGLRYQGRCVLHRLSVCELTVPYGDPRKPHSLKAAFDAGEDGMGCNANSLQLGCDCQGEIYYFDANLCRNDGSGVDTIKNAVCLHEEDSGTAWKHTDWRTDKAEVRRGRRLVVSFVSTIANYEYGFFYYLDLAGGVELDTKLTGVLSTGTLGADEGSRKYGITLDSDTRLYAPVHQHFFCARLDVAIDGVCNQVVEMNVQANREASASNPLANAFWYVPTVLSTEGGAQRACNAATSRYWKVQSSVARNKTGEPTGYKLVPGVACTPFSDLTAAPMLRRAQFLRAALWVTAFDAEQRYPAGDFPNQSPLCDGLPRWTQADRCVRDCDVVLWYNFGVTHQPRLEDWPVMPVEHTGFAFKPSGFCDVSPLMDLPKDQPVANSSCCGD